MRYSKQRDLIYNIVNNSHEHLTADAIYKKARESISNISLGTVYRNLKELIDCGKIRHVKVANDKDVFDKTLHNHAHLSCISCGKVVDVEVDYNKILQYNEIEVTSIDILLTGYCHKCRRRD